MKVKMYNAAGKEAGEAELPENIFGVKFNPDLVHQVALAQRANRRRVLACTKGRGQVSGGGKKPWAQKHTGRARHGSIRSPIWKGGGVAHGPTAERRYAKKINKKMRRKALGMALSEKARRNLLLVLDDLRVEGAKTKALRAVLENLPCKKQKTLVALPGMEHGVIRAANNLAGVTTMRAADLNVLDVLSANYLVMPKSSVGVIGKTFLNTSDQAGESQ